MDLRISQIAELTGLSMRYWQRKAMAGESPERDQATVRERLAQAHEPLGVSV